MKRIKLVVAFAIALSVMQLFSSVVSAQDDINQEQSQDLEIFCDTGSYGQNVSCWAKGKQNQKFTATLEKRENEVVIIREGRVVPVHYAVDAGLDFNTMALAIGSLSAGVGAATISYKKAKK